MRCFINIFLIFANRFVTLKTNMKQNELKKQAAEAAISYLKADMTIGVGTGTTTDYFIDALSSIKHKIKGTIASSNSTAEKLKQLNLPVYDLNAVDSVDIYIDGADEFNRHGYLIKGGGGALTREKIIAASAKKFICLVDETKQQTVLGNFPLPIEVIPMARGLVARALMKLGGTPEYRQGFITDNGNVILDVYNLDLSNPTDMEAKLNNITGVVTNGIFAKRKADVLLIGSSTGKVETINTDD